MAQPSGKWIVALSGASGMRYALRLLEELVNNPEINEVHVIVSEAALRVLHEEENIKLSFASLSSKTLLGFESKKLLFFNPRDIGAPVASGSFQVDGMIVVPCSMSTLGAIAHGVPQNLIHRAADVAIKEMKKLILVPRETPLSAIHLENMLKLSKLNVQMIPAMPGFYHQPRTLEELVDMMVMKILDAMQLSNNLVKRWGHSDNIKNVGNA